MTDAAPETEASTAYKWRWYAFACILAAEVMDLLDSTIVNIAAPSIRDDIGGSYSDIQWFAAAYTLAYAVGLIVGARLGDIHGRRLMFMIGSGGFLVASIACSLAQSPDQLIIGRIVQGTSGALLIPQGLGMIRAMFDEKERVKAFGMFGPVMGLSAVLGPIVAGALINADIFGSNWRAVFWINVPLGALALIGAFFFLPHHERHEKITLDVVGVVLTAAAMFLLVFPLVQGRESGWPLWTYLMVAGSLVLFGVFSWYELRLERQGKSPLIITSLFRKREFTSGLVFCGVFFATVSGVFLCFGLYCQLGLGYSPLRAGVTQAPIAFGIAIGAGIGGALALKLGRTLIAIGLTICSLGMVGLLITLLATNDPHSVDFIPALLLIGIGMGQVFSPMFGIILAAVGDREIGSASGTINATQQFGGALGVAIVATLFFSMISSQAISGATPSANRIQAQFLSAGVGADNSQVVGANFVNCIKARTTAKDPTTSPVQCNQLNASIGQASSTGANPGALGQIIGVESKHAVRDVFGSAFRHTMWLPIVMLLVAIGSAFFLPKHGRADMDH